MILVNFIRRRRLQSTMPMEEFQKLQDRMAKQTLVPHLSSIIPLQAAIKRSTKGKKRIHQQPSDQH